MADVIATVLFVLGRCYSLVADVIATIVVMFLLADVIAWRLMELPTVGVDGRWNSHWVSVLVLILMFCARPHPICVADGTTPSPLNIVWLEPCTIELKPYALIHSCKRKKKTICAKPSRNAGTYLGHQ